MRNGTLRAAPRTQSSIAVAGSDAAGWALVNASPDILTQLRVHSDLQPARAPRDSGLAGIVLVDAQIDHTAGLLMLRESLGPLAIWCTDAVYADLTGGNPLFKVLGHYCGVERCRMVTSGEEFSLPGVPGVRWQAIAVAGKPAPYSPHRDAAVGGDNVALVISDVDFFEPGTLETLRATCAEQEVPILATGAQCESAEPDQLRKPFVADDLVGKVEALVPAH